MNGKTFEEFHAGDRYSTGRRTITEHDILTFVNLVGLTEPLFLDMEYIRKESLFGERIAPGSLTFGMAEGLTVQTGLIHGTGMAFAGLDKMRLFSPVKVNDTIQVEIEVLDTKPVPGPRRRHRPLPPVGQESARRNDHGVRCRAIDSRRGELVRREG